MRYRITHITHYRYSSPVRLKPQTLRLCPRNDGNQWLNAFDLSLAHQPAQQYYFSDTYGNTCCQLRFSAPLDTWEIKTTSEVSTTRANPFDYLAEPWAVQFPIDYPSSMASQLRHYLEPVLGQGMDDAIAPSILAFARDLRQTANNNVGYFLTQLTQKIPTRCTYQQRTEGMPQAAAFTLEKQSGTCRDFAVL
ncbi:MAG: transglutaminase N-terminal domain-containing protein, partial [Cyanobacteria bacterium J06632_3]